MKATELDMQAARAASTAPDIGVMYGRDALNERIANAIAAERERVLAVRRALIDDDRCACENCIREELEEVVK